MGVASGVGLIVGVERGWSQRDERDGGRTAGVRTFTLIGLMGGLAGLLSAAAESPAPWLTCLGALTAVFALFSYREGAAERNFSVTNVVVAMTVFLLAVFAALGDIQVAAAGGVITAAVLAGREHMHQAVERLSWPELRSALLLLAMTAVVLPLLPDRTLDPLGVLNPRELWLLMILAGAVSFAGYIAMRVAGPDKGPPMAGLAGGLASSTAATLAMARLSKDVEAPHGLVAGAALAAMVSVIRATLLAGVIQPSLIPLLAPAVGAAALVFAAGALVALKASTAQPAQAADPGAPFHLKTVLGFGALLAVVMLTGAWVARQVGAAGIFVFAAASGLVDVDAITLSSARLADRGEPLALAAGAILIALAANAIQKAVFGWAFGSRPFARRFAVMSALAIAAGAAAFAVVRIA